MFPNRFEYFRPATLAEALSLLSAHGEDAKLMAGGQSLLSLMKLRLANPKVVIDLGAIAELSGVREEGESIVVGALTTYAEIKDSALLHNTCPLLPQTAALVGDVQVRNRGTLGGSLAHADPAGDMPAAIIALQAEMKAVSPRGERWFAADDFFVAMMTTALAEDEILTEIRVPVLKGQRTLYMKNAPRPSDFAVVGIAVCLAIDPDQTCAEIALGVTGVGEQPYRARDVETALKGKKLEPAIIEEAAAQITHGVEVGESLRASQEFRTHLARVWAARAIQAAANATAAGAG